MPSVTVRPTLSTHGTGHPRLHPLHAGHLYHGEDVRAAIRLRTAVTVLGSDPAADVVVAGLAPRHAEIRRTDDDEYVVLPLSGSVTVNGAPSRRAPLHTGDRVACGGWMFSFARDESTDHVHVRSYGLVRPRGVLGSIEHLIFLLYGPSTQARPRNRATSPRPARERRNSRLG